MDNKSLIQSIVDQHLSAGDAVGWFESLYAAAAGNPSVIPWADLKPNPNLVDWLNRGEIPFAGRAVTVGCGLGDDAEELARRGFDVTAFDVSPTAIDWCRKRFPNSKVNYAVADLLNPPDDWRRRFDFVHETYTLQALPLEFRPRATHSVADFIAPGGHALIICRARDNDTPPAGPPWPLSREDLDQFIRNEHLIQTSFEDYQDASDDPPTRRFRVAYRRS